LSSSAVRPLTAIIKAADDLGDVQRQGTHSFGVGDVF
jgi:hypothetical protein